MTKPVSRLRLPIVALCAGLLAAPAAPAGSLNFTIDFDGVAAGAPANSALGAAVGVVSIVNAVHTPLFDPDGDPIPGSDRWTPDPDPTTPVVRVEDPLSYFYGAAPSGANALNALGQPALLQFTHPVRLESFSATLDNSPYGAPFPVSLLFLDAVGAVLENVDMDQTIPGLTVTVGPVAGQVSAALLPAGAFYDTIRLTVAPEPPAWTLLAGGLPLLSAIVRRRRALRTGVMH